MPAIDRLWLTSRSGAWAGRGFRYQDLVGAWIALQLGATGFDGARLTPEGLDDFSFEAPARHIQVKTRHAGRAEYTLADVARLVVELWVRHQPGIGLGETVPTKFTLVLERSFAGRSPRDFGANLLESVEAQGAALAGAVRARAASATSLDIEQVSQLLALTSVVVLSVALLKRETTAIITDRTGLPAGAAGPVLQALRTVIGEFSDDNAAAAHDVRSSLDLTGVQRILTDTAALIDRASLDEAIRTGSCSVVDFETPLEDSDFYAGTSVQPGHVAAGLVISRPEPVSEALAALRDSRAVLVAGPSGVGKSAVMWLTAHEARHITWYQVHRLDASDVEPLVRLAKAAGAGQYGPVGFVLDGVGTGELPAFDELHRRAASLPGMLLLGSVREEDTIRIATLPDAVVVRPILDEELAARIHAELDSLGKSVQPHWREAFAASSGLTLEYTHLLTSGRRLDDVIIDQVGVRIREGRGVELDVLALVSTADRWGAPLSFDGLQRLIEASDVDLRFAMSRLKQEQLLVQHGDIVSGLHRLRSQAASRAVHETPPPTLSSTIGKLISSVDVAALPTLVGRAATDEPALTADIAEQLHTRITDAVSAAAAFAAARLADYTSTARQLIATLNRHQVALPQQPVVIDLSLLGSELGTMFLPELVAAVTENQTFLAQQRTNTATVLGSLVERLGVARISDLLSGSDNAQVAADLLDPLRDTGLNLTISVTSSLESVLAGAHLPDLADVIEAATAVSAETGGAALQAAGGRVRILDLLAELDVSVIRLAVVTLDDEEDARAGDSDPGGTVDDRTVEPGVVLPARQRVDVLEGRVLYLSDRLSPDARERVLNLAKLGLRCLPDVARAKLSTVLPGVVPPVEVEHAGSGLLRAYALGDRTISWNRLRGLYAKTLIGSSSTTQRLAVGSVVLHDATRYFADLVDSWITGVCSAARLERQHSRRMELFARIQDLEPDIRAIGAETGRTPVEQLAAALAANEKTGEELDVLHTLAQGLVINMPGRFSDRAGYASLAAFARDTLGQSILKSQELPWQLLGRQEPPPFLSELHELLDSCAAVLSEIARDETAIDAIVRSTKGSAHRRAIYEAGVIARKRADLRHERILEDLVRALADSGYEVSTVTQAEESGKAAWPPIATAVLLEVGSYDWVHFLEDLPNLLEQHPIPTRVVTAIPTSDGLPLARYTSTVFSGGNVYRAPEAFERWRDLLPDAVDTALTDAVVQALEALAELSGLTELACTRESGAGRELLQQQADDAAGRYVDARERIGALGVDVVVAAVLDELDTQAEVVQQEAEAGSLPSSSWAAVWFDPVSRAAAFGALLGVATAWDVDPVSSAAQYTAADDVDSEPDLVDQVSE